MRAAHLRRPDLAARLEDSPVARSCPGSISAELSSCRDPLASEHMTRVDPARFDNSAGRCSADQVRDAGPLHSQQQGPRYRFESHVKRGLLRDIRLHEISHKEIRLYRQSRLVSSFLRCQAGLLLSLAKSSSFL